MSTPSNTPTLQYHLDHSGTRHLMVKHDGGWAPGVPLSYENLSKYRYATLAEIYIWETTMELWNRLRELQPNDPLLHKIYPGDKLWADMATERGVLNEQRS